MKSKLEKELDEIKGGKVRKPEKIKPIKLASALIGFAKQFRFEGVEGFDPADFIEKAKPEVLRLMIFSCEMVRENVDGSTQLVFPYFHTEALFNLEGTDEEELFKFFKEILLDRLQCMY